MKVIDTIGILQDGVLTKYRIASANDSDAIKALYTVIEEKLRDLWKSIADFGIYFDSEGYLTQGKGLVPDIFEDEKDGDTCCCCCCSTGAEVSTEEAMDSTYYIRGYLKRLRKIVEFVAGYHLVVDKDGFIVQILDTDSDYKELDLSEYELGPDQENPYSWYMRLLTGFKDFLHSFGIFLDGYGYAAQSGSEATPYGPEESCDSDASEEESDDEADLPKKKKKRGKKHKKCCSCSCSNSEEDTEDTEDTDDTEDEEDEDTEDTDDEETSDTDDTDDEETSDTDEETADDESDSDTDTDIEDADESAD